MKMSKFYGMYSARIVYYAYYKYNERLFLLGGAICLIYSKILQMMN